MPPEDPHPAAIPPAKPSASPPNPAGDAPPENRPANALTPEEQMALYEKELKETDWGHQPC